MAGATQASPHVLVGHSDPQAGARLVSLLTEAGYAAELCASREELLRLARGRGAVAGLVVSLEFEQDRAFSLLGELRSTGLSPAAVMTAQAGEINAAVAAVRAGYSDFLPGPPDARVVHALATALGEQGSSSHQYLSAG